TNKGVKKAVYNALESIMPLPEWLDPALKTREGWADWNLCVQTLHHPEGQGGLSPQNPTRMRLAYDEFLANQLALSMVRHHQRRRQGRVFSTGGHLREKLVAALPFALTGAQERSVGEIDSDMGQPIRMLRLLQGDVGSGKTVV